jgi:hypothetical protein
MTSTFKGGSCATGSSASKALLEGLNRVVGDGLSAQDWFAPKEVEETPVRLPWQPLTPEEQGYERSASGFMVVCMAVKVPGVALHNDLAEKCTRQRNSSSASHAFSHSPQLLHKLAELTTFAVP